MSGRVLQHLLQYLYTGSCHFPQDDLNLGVELVGVADQFLLDPMKLQCEKVLSNKIDKEVRKVEGTCGDQTAGESHSLSLVSYLPGFHTTWDELLERVLFPNSWVGKGHCPSSF